MRLFRNWSLESANCSFKGHGIGNDIVSLASLNHSDRHHYRVSRIDLSWDRLINQCDQLRGNRNWIYGSAWSRAMTATADHLNGEILAERGSRPGCDPQAADLAVRIDMKSYNSGYSLDRSLFYQLQGAVASLLRRLKYASPAHWQVSGSMQGHSRS